MLQKNMLTASGEKRSIHVWVFLCYNLEQCRICTITDVKECWCFWCWLFFVLQNLQKRIQIIVFCLGHVSFNLYVECRKFWAIQIYFDMKRIAANMMSWNIIVIESYLNGILEWKYRNSSFYLSSYICDWFNVFWKTLSTSKRQGTSQSIRT